MLKKLISLLIVALLGFLVPSTLASNFHETGPSSTLCWLTKRWPGCAR